ncbi:MAG: guanylate kinase [Acidobacteriales bacterium]|nr:guanylate kinase [Terriglobales bacterium]
MAGILFIISAPSGSGKSTLVNELLRLVKGLEFSVSYTTRGLRGSEREGREYHFVTRERFEAMIAAGEFLEHAEVYGHYYGTAAHTLEDAATRGCDLLLDIDVQGAVQVKEKRPGSVSIFILPPSRQVLEKRLRNRSMSEGAVDDKVIELRLQEARKEIENSPVYDYSLVNDRLDDSVDHLSSIVLAERALRSGGALSPEEQRAVAIAKICSQRSGPNRKLRAILDTFGQAVAN